MPAIARHERTTTEEVWNARACQVRASTSETMDEGRIKVCLFLRIVQGGDIGLTKRLFFRVKAAMEKQHFRGKKRSFLLETGFFSDSIHGANAKDNF